MNNIEDTDCRMKEILLQVEILQQSLKEEKASREHLQETVTRLSNSLDTYLRASSNGQANHTSVSRIPSVSRPTHTSFSNNFFAL